MAVVVRKKMKRKTRSKLLAHGKSCGCRSFDRYVVFEGKCKLYYYACRSCQWRVKEDAGKMAA